MRVKAEIVYVVLIVTLITINIGLRSDMSLAAETKPKPTLMRLSTVASAINPLYISLRRFADLVKKEYGDAVNIELYPNAQMGGDKEQAQNVINGTLQGGVIPTSALNMVGRAPEVKMLTCPFLLKSIDEAYKLYEVYARDQLMGPMFERGGFKMVAFIPMGMTSLGNNVRPVVNVEDARNLKIRSWQDNVMLSTLKGFGANPVSLPYSEVIPGLQQRQIDGLITTDMHILTDGLLPVLKYITDIRIECSFFTISLGLDWFKSQPKEMQTKLLKIGEEVTQYSHDMARDNSVQVYKQFEKSAKVTYLTAEQRQAFAATAGAAHNLLKKEVGDEFFNKVFSIAKGL
jgi:TRAP-type transport system periplasmic protein